MSAQAWKLSKYGVISGPYFPVFGLIFNPNAGKCGPGKTPYLDTFHAVVPGQTEGRRKVFLEWTSIDLSSKLSPTYGDNIN